MLQKKQSPMVAKKLGPNTNFEIDILKFSALVKTERDVKLIAVPAHQPIRCACIKKLLPKQIIKDQI